MNSLSALMTECFAASCIFARGDVCALILALVVTGDQGPAFRTSIAWNVQRGTGRAGAGLTTGLLGDGRQRGRLTRRGWWQGFEGSVRSWGEETRGFGTHKPHDWSRQGCTQCAVRRVKASFWLSPVGWVRLREAGRPWGLPLPRRRGAQSLPWGRQRQGRLVPRGRGDRTCRQESAAPRRP